MPEEKKLDLAPIVHLVKTIWKTTVWKHKWVILALSIVASWYMYRTEANKAIYYNGSSTFILESEDITSQSNSMTQGSLIPNFFKVEKTNRNILMALINSNKMKELTLLSAATIGGKDDLLINHLSKIHGSLNESNTFDTSFKYGESESLDAYLRSWANFIADPYFQTGINADGTSYIYYSHTNQDFTHAFIVNHFKTISEYYSEKRLAKAKKFLRFAKEHREEVKNKLDVAERGIAKINDKNRYAIMNRALTDKAKLQRNIEIYNEMFLNAELSYQSAKSDVLKKTPYIQVIDDIRKPLARTENKPWSKAIIGFIIVLILGIGISIGLYFGKEFYNKELKGLL